MAKSRKIIVSISTVLYSILCIYTASFCVYSTIRYIREIFYSSSNNLMKFIHDFLNFDEGMAGFYISMLIIGCIACFVLMFLFRKKKNIFYLLLGSIVPHISIPFSLSILYKIDNSAIKYLFWLFIIISILTVGYLMKLLLKVLKDDKQYTA